MYLVNDYFLHKKFFSLYSAIIYKINEKVNFTIFIASFILIFK